MSWCLPRLFFFSDTNWLGDRLQDLYLPGAITWRASHTCRLSSRCFRRCPCHVENKWANDEEIWSRVKKVKPNLLWIKRINRADSAISGKVSSLQSQTVCAIIFLQKETAKDSILPNEQTFRVISSWKENFDNFVTNQLKHQNKVKEPLSFLIVTTAEDCKTF